MFNRSARVLFFLERPPEFNTPAEAMLSEFGASWRLADVSMAVTSSQPFSKSRSGTCPYLPSVSSMEVGEGITLVPKSPIQPYHVVGSFS